MGFGLLLCGYFLLTFMSVGAADYCFITFILGAIITAQALGKLKDYNPRFAWGYAPAGVYGLLAVYHLLLAVDDQFLLGLPVIREAAVLTAVDWATFLCELAMAAVILWSVLELVITIGMEKLRVRSVRNAILTGLWALAQVVMLLFPSFAALENQAPLKLLLLFQLLVYFLNNLLLFSCFRQICPVGEEFGKPSKPSRFKFINDMNARLDEKAERARAEFEANQQKQNGKYSAKNNNRHHKKKK